MLRSRHILPPFAPHRHASAQAVRLFSAGAAAGSLLRVAPRRADGVWTGPCRACLTTSSSTTVSTATVSAIHTCARAFTTPSAVWLSKRSVSKKGGSSGVRRTKQPAASAASTSSAAAAAAAGTAPVGTPLTTGAALPGGSRASRASSSASTAPTSSSAQARRRPRQKGSLSARAREKAAAMAFAAAAAVRELDAAAGGAEAQRRYAVARAAGEGAASEFQGAAVALDGANDYAAETMDRDGGEGARTPAAAVPSLEAEAETAADGAAAHEDGRVDAVVDDSGAEGLDANRALDAANEVGGGGSGSASATSAQAAGAAAGTSGAAAAVSNAPTQHVPAVGSLLDFESPLNLRLATLTRHSGKAFRSIAVYLPLNRTSLNFDITFEDIASGARLVCKLDEVKTLYFEWVSLFRASFLALFVPTLQHPNATLLQNAILSARAARPLPPAGSFHPRVNEEADHLFFSYTKLREVISKKRRDTDLNPQLLTVAVLNAYAEEWRNFISTPLSCVPQNYLQAAFNFKLKDNAILNKELLHAQLAGAAVALLSGLSSPGAGGAAGGSGGVVRRGGAGTSAAAHLKNATKPESWSLIFISSPARTAVGVSAIPPMQDLLTGQFVEPLSLSERFVVYIIGTGGAAESFAHFPVARKGSVALSVLLQDIESQLALQRSSQRTLTTTLAQAVDSFSRLTWMGLMVEETTTGQLRVPHPPNAFYSLQRRTVQREIVPGFLEAVFAPSNRLMGPAGGGMGGHGSRAGDGAGGGAGGGANERGAANSYVPPKDGRRLGEHIRLIYNNPDRLENEQALRDKMRGRKAYFLHATSASVTAARRADNPFSARNGLVDVSGQLWSSLTLLNPPAILHREAHVDASGATRQFVEPDSVIPDDLPLGPPDAANPGDRAENAVIIAWDAKRVLLFLAKSPRLREFLFNGGRVWCAQYAQYLLKGFNHLNLATMERTLLQYHDGPLKTAMHPLAKLKLIYETQLDVAVNTRQLNSILHRMDGLLASMEMELNGLQVAPQSEVSRFANTLRLDRERLEKVLQEKILDFTKSMDDEVRQRINFRSPQDISTIIYGGALCRHLGSRFVPVRPTKYPITALFPHAVCHVTGTPTPESYAAPESILGTFQTSSAAGSNPFTTSDVDRSLVAISRLCKRATMEQVVQGTAVIVLVAKVKMGGLLEQISLYVPSTADAKEGELNVRVAIDDILPVTDSPDLVTVGTLKEMLLRYAPLQRLRGLIAAASGASSDAATKKAKKGSRSGGKGGADTESVDLRNLLIVTNCTHERLEPLVDTGVVAAIAQAVLGSSAPGAVSAGERPPFERVCFADLHKVFPAAPQGADSFENDFSELSTTSSVSFSARAHWDLHTREIIGVGGVEGVVKAMLSHCASLMGTPRDPLRSSHPVPTAAVQGLHGQEQASTPGMLWMVTPANLHPVLRRFLKGRSASSGADAMERVTVFLSPYKDIDLSFFTALQQLRYTEKKLQLFEEGCLFRAVLPECNDRVHGELCHCVTATGRLSSQSPNLQNIPREEDLRRLIRSRFGAKGRMIEADYSQLEVVVLAALSRDPRMMQELRDKVDFHCLRVSLMTKEPYETVAHKAKVEKDPQYVQLRQQAKVFSFQRQYGAGVSTIATTTGLTEQEVDRLISAEEQHYKELGRYYRLVMDCVDAGSDRLLRLRTLDTAQWNANMRRVIMLTEPLYYFVVATGSKFDFAKDRKSIPRLKNYPVQGLAGEIVQIICGKIVRLFYQKRCYGGKAFLVNTVHDCVWVDAHESVAEEVKADLNQLMGDTQQIIGDLWPEMGLDVPFRAEIHAGITLGEMTS